MVCGDTNKLKYCLASSGQIKLFPVILFNFGWRCHLTHPPSQTIRFPQRRHSWYTAVSEAQWIVGILQWEICFKLPNFYLKSKRLLVFFCLVQNGPGVTWVACIGHRERSKWSFGYERAFLEVFWTFMSHAAMEFQNKLL